MPSISTDIRIVFWIIAATAGVVVAILGNELGKNVLYIFSRRGRPPTRRPLLVWLIFFISLVSSIAFGALAAFAPTLPEKGDNVGAEPQLGMWGIDYFSNIYLNQPTAYHIDQPAEPNNEGGYTIAFKSFDLRSDPQIPQGNFSVRMSGLFRFEDGYYEFLCKHHDGCRVYVDGEVWVDAWWDGAGEHALARDIYAGEHIVSIEFYDKSGLGLLEVIWKRKAAITPTETATLPTPLPITQPATMLFEDIFIDNRNNWIIDSGSSRIAAGKYTHRVECPATYDFYYCGTYIPIPFTMPKNLRMEIDATVSELSQNASIGFGFQIRRNKVNTDHYYINYFITENIYTLKGTYNKSDLEIIPSTPINFINPGIGATNRFGIEIKDYAFTPIVNGNRLPAGEDGNLPNAGDSYLVIYISRGSSVTIELDNLVVQEVR